MAEFEAIRYETAGRVARLTLNRPDHMNGMTNRMGREICQALEAAAVDDRISVLVLTGAGTAFCPGADLHHFTSGGADERLTPHEFQATALLHQMPAVTIAAINGACAGAGLGLAPACDVRLMIETARLNTAFLDVAVAGDMAIPWSLPRLVGAGRARDLSLFPRRIHADEALAVGLVSRVLSAQSFGDDVDALVNTLLEKSPTALTGLKQNYVAAEQMPLREFVQHEAKRHLQIAATEHTAEAFRAFVEKRKPNFT